MAGTQAGLLDRVVLLALENFVVTRAFQPIRASSNKDYAEGSQAAPLLVFGDFLQRLAQRAQRNRFSAAARPA